MNERIQATVLASVIHSSPVCVYINSRDGATGGRRAAAHPTLNTGALFQPAGQGIDGMLSDCAERSLLGRAVEMTRSGKSSQRGPSQGAAAKINITGFCPCFLKGPNLAKRVKQNHRFLYLW